MRMEAGTCTAFVGPSGAGKTTAALLAGRYQDVLGGAVRLGGVDVRDIATDTLMDMICFVFQDTFLFSATVRENIRVGRPNASDAQVEEAARHARAHEFILQLPQGYDTPLGEGGLRLSGGERQRLSLARAILKDAPIVILDEATAYADPENEVLLQEGVSRLLSGKTVIIIGHRLSALTRADAICVFEAGRLAGMGRHDELLRNCALYARMWELQEAAARWTVAGEEALHAQAV
jgi:ATP-binding cassette subfamily B protein